MPLNTKATQCQLCKTRQTSKLRNFLNLVRFLTGRWTQLTRDKAWSCITKYSTIINTQSFLPSFNQNDSLSLPFTIIEMKLNKNASFSSTTTSTRLSNTETLPYFTNFATSTRVPNASSTKNSNLTNKMRNGIRKSQEKMKPIPENWSSIKQDLCMVKPIEPFNWKFSQLNQISKFSGKTSMDIE